MFNALEAYPQDVSLYTFCRKFDDRFGPLTDRTKDYIEPIPAIADETLQTYIRMRIRNLTDTGIILALGTEHLYLEPTPKPAIGQWTQNPIGMRHIEFGASYQCLQVPILEDIAHVEEIPDPEPFTLFW